MRKPFLSLVRALKHQKKEPKKGKNTNKKDCLNY